MSDCRFYRLFFLERFPASDLGVVWLTFLLLLHAMTLIVSLPLPLSCTVVAFPSSHRILYRVNGP